jgi:hypothetical protein
MIENQNQPAFPVSEETTDKIDREIRIYTGLTKREFFTAMAMQGLLAGRFACPDTINCSPETISDLAIKYADQLLSKL